MTADSTSTRRSFLKKGALLAAPLAPAAPAAVLADDGLKARLARLEDEAAIRKLHQDWLRRINTRTDHITRTDDVTGAGGNATAMPADLEGAAFGAVVRSIAADHAGQPEAIEVAADGKRAVGRFPCAVEIGTAIAPDCTLAQMAHAQGDGFVCRTERRLLKVEYVKASGGWMIAKVEFPSA